MIRYGVIGVGHMGQYHCGVCNLISNIDFVGVYDINKSLATVVAEKYGVRAFDSMEELAKEVDAVSIAVPTGEHYSVSEKMLKSGVHVLVEKPMTDNIDDAMKLADIASSMNVILQVGHIERFNGAVSELKNIVMSPYFIEAKRFTSRVGKKYDSGVILDLMVHDIDIVLNLVKSDVKKLYATGKKLFSNYEDIATTTIVFENNTIALLSASRVVENKVRTLEITDKDSYIFLDYATQDINIYRKAASQYYITRKEIKYTQDIFMERVFVHKVNPLQLEIEHFVACIDGSTKPIVSIEDDIKTLRITLDILNMVNGGS